MIKVVKFGGSSLADAAQFRKAAAIILKEPERRFVVVSAPGKRSRGDQKITDLLLECHALASENKSFETPFQTIRKRFCGIAAELGLDLDLADELTEVHDAIARGASRDYVASRGEYFNALIMADFLQALFLDAAECIFFNENGRVDTERSGAILKERLRDLPRAVLPGFYGSDRDGIKTFSRGGSDITGSIVAEAVGADLYENWTDVSGLMMADPRIIEDPVCIDVVTYRELRELSYMGATVLHEEAIFPVRRAGIPINIRNTNAPEDPGPMIVPNTEEKPRGRVITGIAGKTGFSAIYIEKDLMNAELGYGRRVLEVLEHQNINFEHLPSGIDSITVAVNTAEIAGKEDAIIEELNRTVSPDAARITEGLALIAIVGRGMVHSPGTASRIFSALAGADINIRMIDQGSSELTIIVGVAAEDYESALRAIYWEFYPRR